MSFLEFLSPFFRAGPSHSIPMQAPFKTGGRIVLARFFRGAASWRSFGTVMLGAIAWLWFAPCGVFAQSDATIDLSPLAAKSTLLSATDPAQEISVLLSLPLGDAKGAADFVQHVSNPKDPLYRKYITPEEYAARFGANAADYAALKDWATANGLIVEHESLARTSLTVRGAVAQFQTLFKTQLSNYRSPKGDEFYSASIRPTVPSAISSKVAGVIGLTESALYAPHVRVGKVLGESPATPANRGDTAGGTGPGGTYAASDLRTAYLIPTYGGKVPQTVAVFEQGGFVPSDVEKYVDRNQLPNVPVKPISVNGSSTKVSNPGVEVEAVLDIDMIIGINPAVKEVLVYVDSFRHDPFNVAIVDAVDQVAQENKAQTLSISYGLDEGQQPAGALNAENTALLQTAAEGITVLVSAGDDGAYGRTGASTFPAKLNAPDPGSQPLVTSVGGTSLFTFTNQQYLGEEVWNDLGIGDGATGGGVSSHWPLPSYQNPSYVTFNGGSATHRNVPDIAAVGNPLTGVGIYSKANGGWLQIGGTSVSAPIWGGYVSILNSGLNYLTGTSIGFFNPTLYSIGFAFPSGTVSGGSLYPVLDGSNGNVELFGTAGYNAGLAYNNCCGSGSLWGPIAFQVLTSETGGTPPGAVTGLTATPSKTSVKISWAKSTGATGYAVVLYVTSNGSITFSAESFITKKTTIDLVGLTPVQTYKVFVGAVNSGGSTQASVSFTTK
jgi:subtilase family serine protease